MATCATVGWVADGAGAAPTPTGSISVTVFQDYNANGVRNLTGDTANPAVDGPVSGATVTAVCLTDNGADGANGTGDGETYSAAQTATPGAPGTYTFASLPGSPCRVEVTALPAGMFAGPLGPDNGGLVQFADVGATVSVGVNRPSSFCQNVPNLAVPCATFGDAIAGSGKDNAALHAFPWTGTGAQAYPPARSPEPTVLATAKQVGSLFGVEYRTASATIFASAYTKIYESYGPGGAGAIYTVSPTGATAPTVFATIPNAGTLPARATFAPNNGPNHGDWLSDAQYWDKVGKSSLGDIELTPDESTLWVVNMNDRKLYPVNASTGAVGVGVALPLATGAANACAADQVRPFGLGSNGTTMYVGMVCAGPAKADLAAYVYSFNAATGAASAAPVFETKLTYVRGRAGDACGPDPYHADWNAWSATNVWNGSSSPAYCAYPQPMLSDIDVAADGGLIMSFRDRFGDQSGFNQPFGPFGGGGSGNSAGDMLKACVAAGGGWALENDGSCGGAAGAGVGDNEGPGTGEFFSDSIARTTGGGSGADEIGVGAATVIPGHRSAIQVVRDPHTSDLDAWGAGGVRTVNTVSGAVTNFYEIYDKCSSGALQSCPPGRTPAYAFGKANGLSDVTAACDRAPVEIGNRVWLDANKNGQQDPGERPLAGVPVTLTIGPATTVATTDANGVYVFSSDSRPAAERGNLSSGKYGVAGLVPGASVILSVPTTVTADGKAHELTSPNAGSDTTDSDAAKATGATAAITVGAPGRNDHTWDFGYVVKGSTPQTIDLAIAKRVTSAGPYKAGSTVTFQLAVTNNGPATAKVGFTVHDRLPVGLTFAGVATPAQGAGYACGAPVGRVVVCTSDHTLAKVVAGAPKDLLTITAKVASPAPAPGKKLKNVTWVLPADDELVETIPMSPTEPTESTNTATTPTNNDSEASITLAPPTSGVYDLALIKTTKVKASEPQPVGAVVDFTITVANQGTVQSGKFTITDTIPSGMAFVSATGTNSRSGRIVTWTVKNLAPGAKASFVIRLKLIGDETRAEYKNWAEISTDSGDDEDSTPDTDTGADGQLPNDDVINHNDISKDTVPGDEDDNDFERIIGAASGVA